jgi:hypothetical protein
MVYRPDYYSSISRVNSNGSKNFNIVMPPALYRMIDQAAFNQNVARSVLAKNILRRVLTDKELRNRVLEGK